MTMNTHAKIAKGKTCLISAIAATLLIASTGIAGAVDTQTLSGGTQSVDISKSSFRVVVCDGPDYSRLTQPVEVEFNGESYTVGLGHNPKGYVPCNFNGVMLTVQRIINILMVLGVLGAIGGFSYAGYLYIVSGSNPGKRSIANGIFSKVGIGFIIMLSAWFVVYQLLSWLTSPGFTALLGKP